MRAGRGVGQWHTLQCLFVAEGFDGVEAGGLPCRVDAEDNPDQGARDERGGNPEKGEDRGHLEAIAHQRGEAGAEEDADDHANERQNAAQFVRLQAGGGNGHGLGQVHCSWTWHRARGHYWTSS